MRDFIISAASGLTVAILSSLFFRRRPAKTGPSQTMMMNSSRGRGVTWFLAIFLIVFAGAFLLLQR
jgi:hypothetical protein